VKSVIRAADTNGNSRTIQARLNAPVMFEKIQGLQFQ
jgi:hypothetical protein